MQKMKNSFGNFPRIGRLIAIAVLAALGCAVSVRAAVTPYSYYSRPDGTPLLIPAVREYKAGEGSVKFPAAVTVSVPKGEELIVEEIAAELERFPEIKVAAGGDDSFFRFVVTDKNVPQDPEGYTLAVTAKGVTVASRTTDGVFRGAQTVRNLLHNTPGPELKLCTIADWPEFQVRGYTFNLRVVKAKEIDQVFRTVEALAALKMNTVFISLEDTFPYKVNPFTKNRSFFPRETLERLVDYCRRRHIRIIPTLQVLSHAWWMTRHPDWNSMKEGDPNRDWDAMPCPYNEQARELTRMALEEQIAFYKSDFFYVPLDEIYLCPFQKCERCRKTDAKKILADYLAFLQGILDKNGVRMIVCQDSFQNNFEWQYGDWYRTQLRRDTWVRYWGYGDMLLEKNTAASFREFNLMGNAICGKPFNVSNMTKLMKANGAKGMNMTYWYFSNTGVLGRLWTETPDSLGGFTVGADMIWNFRDVPCHQVGYDGTFEMMRLLYPERVTLPPRTGHAEPMPIALLVNSELSSSGEFPRFADDASLKEFSDALAAMPERFRLTTSPGGKYYAARLAAAPKGGRAGIGFAIGKRKAERISFLLTASRPRNAMEYHAVGNYGKKRFAYSAAARLTICYVDGTKKTLDLGYRKEITDWNRPFGGFGMRMAVRGFDADRRYVTFGIYDFVNPHPEKPIADIIFNTNYRDGISPALLAVSAWGLDRPFPKSDFEADPEAVAKRPGVAAAAGGGIRRAVSFDGGMEGVTVDASPALLPGLKSAVVDDPEVPSGGKVLKITIPAGKYRGVEHDAGYLRVDVSFADRVPSANCNVVTEYRVAAASGSFSHCNVYLYGEGSPDRRLFRAYYLPVPKTPEWQRDFSSVWSKEGKRVLTELADARFRKISFFFRSLDRGAEIRLGMIGDTTVNVSEVPVWREGREAE